jgi:uncharacterized Ntn-hydrolase superfamily protein
MTRINPNQIRLFTAVGLVIAFCSGQAFAQQHPRFHTRSIVACDPATSQCGIAVVSFPSGVSAVVPVGEAGVIVANQSFPSYATARAIIERVKMGDSAPAALAAALALDPLSGSRQFGVAALSTASPTGVTVASFTGTDNIPETCSAKGPTYAVQANLQSSSAVCNTMAGAFNSTIGSLPRRLLAALKAGTPVGTDARGEFSASIKVFSNTWALAEITPISAEASVDRSLDWEAALEFGLNVYLAMITPGDSSDFVELNDSRVKGILKVLRDLGYYNGPVSGWSSEAEAALARFEEFNLFFPKPTVVQGGRRFIDAPLADYVIMGAPRGVLTPSP